MNYQFLDAAYPDGTNDKSADPFLGALKAANAAGFTFYLGGDICLHAWPKAIVDAIRAQYPGMAIHVTTLRGGIGAEAVSLARAYGLPAGYKVALDIEPGIFKGMPPAVAASYADAWCDAVRAAGYSPVVYGTAETCAACANRADYIWLTVPGVDNPDNAGLSPAFFAGRRAIQYASVVLNGVSCDVSNSQYPLGTFFGPGGGSLGVDDLTPDEHNTLINIAAAIGTGPNQTLGRDLEALKSVFGVTASTAADPTRAVPANNPNYLGWSRDETARETAILAALADLKAHPAIQADPTLLALVQSIAGHFTGK